jgi:hypothetical protein
MENNINVPKHQPVFTYGLSQKEEHRGKTGVGKSPK